MKRVLLIAIALIALVFATAAFGKGGKPYSGSDSDSQCGVVPDARCGISFKGVVKDSTVTDVRKFVYDGIPITCNEGTFASDNRTQPLPHMRVHADRTFGGTFESNNNGGSDEVVVTGKFTKSYRSASGTLQVSGNFPDAGATGCDTGVDKWSAKRQAP